MSAWNSSRLAADYIRFQESSLSPFHAVATVMNELEQAGFSELRLDADEWNLSVGARYRLVHPDRKSVVAFCVGPTPPSAQGYAIIGAHTDSPVLRLRLNPWHEDEYCVRLATHHHGAPIERSWLDRPLRLAGCVYSLVRRDKQVVFDPATGLPEVKVHLAASSGPIAVIPDLAIHLDRQKNAQGAINCESMLAAVIGVNGSQGRLTAYLQEALDLPRELSIDGFELALAPHWPHTLVGVNRSMIVGPRHDDLAMVFCALQSLKATTLAADHYGKTPVAAFFDAEETGSRTSSGAGSAFFRDVLLRIARHHPQTEPAKDPEAMLAKSFLISADMAHAYHPAFPDRHDINHRLKINGGLVIKDNADDRYATSGYSAAVLAGLCEASGVPMQKFVNRQDLACGSTIGPILAAALGCPAADVGTAMWAMHSTAETMGCEDLVYACKAFHTFYKASNL